MIHNLKKRISNNFHENFNSFIENRKNRKTITAYNQILEISNSKSFAYKKLLFDGHFYNLGYFYRLQLLRSSVFSNIIKEYAYIWNSNQRICRNILKSIGIKNIYDLSKKNDENILLESENIADSFKSPKDIIDYPFPEGVPGSFLYDVILKKQRSNTVSLKDKNIKKYLYEFLMAIKSSKDLINKINPDLVALSHAVSFQCAPMAYIASKEGIKTIILTGGHGLPRFIKIKQPIDLKFGIPHPSKKDLDSLESEKVKIFQKFGYEYLKKRISGKAIDLSGKLAFSKNKSNLIKTNFNNKNRKVIAIYVSNWFDFPHTFGMTRFLDILDWVRVTIDNAALNKEVIWLIKPHPAEKWYGGITLKDTLKEDLPSNIYLLSNDCSGQAVMEVADALVTLHGTAAIEYAACGKPVLVADKGWFHDCDFVLFSDSKKNYTELLRGKWYENFDKEQIKANSKLFAGIYFGYPSWQKGTILPDDTEREAIRNVLPEFVKSNKNTIKKEIKCIKDWLTNDEIDYHTFKMINYQTF